jgi:flagellar biogenesis protein FliO
VNNHYETQLEGDLREARAAASMWAGRALRQQLVSLVLLLALLGVVIWKL